MTEAKASFEEAARLSDDAARGWAEDGFVLEHAYALLGLGRCRAALGEEDAREALTTAARVTAGSATGHVQRSTNPPVPTPTSRWRLPTRSPSCEEG